MANSEVSRLSFNGDIYEIADELARQSVGTARTLIATEAARLDAVDTGLAGRITNLETSAGAVLVAKTASAMSDTSKIYVYTGSESGKTAGHWYYHNGSAWTDGGAYTWNLDAIDATLTLSNKGADAKVTGDRLTAAEAGISALIGTIANEYDSQAYARGDYCSHNGTLYYCTTATTGDFDISKWASVNVMDQLRNRSLIYNGVYESTALSEYNNLASNLPFNTFSWIQPSWFTDMSGIPEGGGQIIYLAQTSNVGRTQIFVQSALTSGCIYLRYASPNENFKSWRKFGQIDDTLSKSNASADSKIVGDDLASTYDGSVSYKRGDYCLYGGVIYSCIASTTGSFDSSKWSTTNVMSEFRNKGLIWNNISESRAASEYNNLAYNLPFNTFSFVSPSWFTDMYNKDGITGTGMIFYVALSKNVGRTQIFIQTDGQIFTRYANASATTFKNWVNINNWYVNHTYDTTAHYYAYGDSTTKGQIGTWSGSSSGTSSYNYPVMAGKRLNMVTHNLAVGGQGLCTDYNDIISGINETTFEENTRLITVGWAYNDVSTYPSLNFGDYTSTDTSSFVGKYYNVMKLLQQKNPNALVALVTGFGYPGGNLSQHIYANLLNQFTHSYTFSDTTKTVKEMYDTLEAMCNLHGWACINQAKGCAFNEFNASDVFGDNIHPTNNGYKIYSNFLTAKICGLFANNKY